MKNIFTAFIITILFTTALFGQWTDMQSAEFVIGQPNLATNIMACSANGLAGPYSVAIDFQHSKLYVGDADNRRVLRYAYPITGNQPTAELVFGQSNFTTDSVQDFYNRMGPLQRQNKYYIRWLLPFTTEISGYWTNSITVF
jgi:hypothetical protein